MKKRGDYRDIIKSPLVTEKSTMNSTLNKYTFEVDPSVNKIEIRKAIESIFKVKVIKVNTIKIPAKTKRMGKYVGKTNEKKKAVVTLKEGQSIQVGGVSLFEH
ncbi:MAG: 50S ribosomal protein L23 [Armatimonadota bacterium]